MAQYKGFWNIKKHPAPKEHWLKVQYLVTGAGAPERQGWTSFGMLLPNGNWSLIYDPSFETTHFPLEPTHWRELINLQEKTDERLIDFEQVLRNDVIGSLSVYGKVEILEVTDEQVEVKVTEGFTGKYEPTMRVGEIVMNAYRKFKFVKFAKSEEGLCHYIFN